MAVISLSPIPALVFYSQSLPGKGSLLCTVGDVVELHTQTVCSSEIPGELERQHPYWKV